MFFGAIGPAFLIFYEQPPTEESVLDLYQFCLVFILAFLGLLIYILYLRAIALAPGPNVIILQYT
jgi:hypothetical protein